MGWFESCRLFAALNIGWLKLLECRNLLKRLLTPYVDEEDGGEEVAAENGGFRQMQVVEADDPKVVRPDRLFGGHGRRRPSLRRADDRRRNVAEPKVATNGDHLGHNLLVEVGGLRFSTGAWKTSKLKSEGKSYLTSIFNTSGNDHQAKLLPVGFSM